ncbi:sigma factor-like helix-turn-helix DNA-binding protein [Streptomyces hesseae]|uniref:Sigma factor-like helix-turn-helix DNA-binding protein n=1 Tax=Streptomyces hesseae TaxID=3075519 RepID=A0ABU2SWT7_9ACTN|nr:sigma factor-like helix-turn-helix DNA-binding protein [Streptomyces sp. DSM 40473]MDT0452495.1 sigma factor-like helix-turn-helix DNA-binding protein [Streptomyces sp. DSM 40473]
MRERQDARERRRAREFEAFAGGAGGRLLRTALLLTGDREAAERLLTRALARTYAAWDGLGGLGGEDPYERTRQELVARYARSARGRFRLLRPFRRGDLGPGLLARLTPQERLVVVLRLHEGVAEEQTAAALGVSVERVRALCARAVLTVAA